MELFFFIGVVLSVFLMVLLIIKKNKTLADKILTLWMAIISFHTLLYYFDYTGISIKYPYLLGLSICFPLFHGPFLYIYTYYLTSKKQVFNRWQLLNFLPIILGNIYLMPFFIKNTPEKLIVFDELNRYPNIFRIIINYLSVISGNTYIILSFARLQYFKKLINENFSYTEKININWLRYIIWSMAGIWIVVTVVFSIQLFAITNIRIDVFIYSVITLAVITVGFFGVKQVGIFTENFGSFLENIEQNSEFKTEISDSTHKKSTKSIADKKRYIKSGLKEDAAIKIKEDLLFLMKIQKLYLNNKLTLKDVAEQLHIHPNYVSQVINEHLNRNFYDFVNEYRVEEFKEKVKKSEHQYITITALAFDCGFNSKSSFNTFFKKVTGITPIKYIRTL